MHTAAVNGVRHDKGASNIRHGYGGKQQGRSTGAAYFPEDEVALTGFVKYILFMVI